MVRMTRYRHTQCESFAAFKPLRPTLEHSERPARRIVEGDSAPLGRRQEWQLCGGAGHSLCYRRQRAAANDHSQFVCRVVLLVVLHRATEI